MLERRSSGIWIFAALEDFCNTTLRRLNKWCWLTFASPLPCSHVKKIKTIVTLIWYWPFYIFPVSTLSQSGLFAHSLLCVYNVHGCRTQAVYPVQVLAQKETLYAVALWIWCVLPCNWEDSLAAGVRYFHREPRERERELLELTTWRPSVVTLPTVLQLSLQFDQDIISWY